MEKLLMVWHFFLFVCFKKQQLKMRAMQWKKLLVNRRPLQLHGSG